MPPAEPRARRTVAVTGARGKTGAAVVAALRARGMTVREVGRAEAADPVSALRGCEAVYLVAPNLHPDEPGLVRELLDAAREAGVARVGYHSVVAPYAPAMPHHLGKAAAEDLVRRSGLRWTILQPCAYVQNLLPALRAPRPELAVAYDPESRFGLVGLADVAEAAATVLAEPGHDGACYELGGPAPVSVRDVAVAAGRVLGRAVPVRRVPAEEWAAGPGARLPERERAWLLAMFDYYDRYGLPAGSLALRGLLGREPAAPAAVLAAELAPWAATARGVGSLTGDD